MFTVKQIVNNATSVYEVPEVTIARKGSEQWRQAWELAEENEISNPDLIETSPAIFADEMAKEYLSEVQFLIVPRAEVTADDCIAIIITNQPSPVAPELPEVGGSGYQFIYRGDQVYIMNTAGATIETVK